jgi:hypothetical protein
MRAIGWGNPARDEPVDLAVGPQHMDPFGQDVGDVEPAVGADLQSVGDGIVAGEPPEIFDLAVGPNASDPFPV